jgi:hypothetical protein
MRFFRESCRFLCLPLAALMLLVSMPWLKTAQAALVTTDQVISDSAAAASDREKIVRFLQQGAVREQLVVMGVDPSEVEARLAALSPAELAQLSARIDEMPAGQSPIIGPIVGAILIIFLVLLVTDLLGMTDVFPFVKKHR